MFWNDDEDEARRRAEEERQRQEALRIAKEQQARRTREAADKKKAEAAKKKREEQRRESDLEMEKLMSKYKAKKEADKNKKDQSCSRSLSAVFGGDAIFGSAIGNNQPQAGPDQLGPAGEKTQDAQNQQGNPADQIGKSGSNFPPLARPI